MNLKESPPKEIAPKRKQFTVTGIIVSAIIVFLLLGTLLTVGPPLWGQDIYEVNMLVAGQIFLAVFAACAITAVAGAVLFVRGKKRIGKVLLLLAMILFVLATLVLPRILHAV